MRIPLGLMILGMAVALAGCGRKPLHDLRSNSRGPDEFMVLPVKPLTAPQDYDLLPAPTPGGANLVDQTPRADAVVALGGRATALDPDRGVPGSDGALITATGRYGVPANTRTTLAEADAQFRKRQGRMTSIKLFPVDRYRQVYRREIMDPYEANDTFRRSGFGTPTAPPTDQ
ncbi:DUF3035 domain-containing protein [Sedimentitalea sp. HM32M-2]|uniref:DUF3035 domain-containing protein n=1 Tax=Sedimentitalea sp. HM32M-2 TaxID=3351566 RepID=UPI003642E41A